LKLKDICWIESFGLTGNRSVVRPMTSQHLSHETKASLDFRDLDQKIPERMPVLEQYLKRYAGTYPLSGVTALFIQHQLGNHVLMTKALIQLGLNPNQVHWLDITYTANPIVRTALQELGIPRENFRVHSYTVTEPYMPYQRRRVQQILYEFMRDPPERLLVLDDGAYLLEAMATFKQRLPRVAVVEQTTRGLIKIDENASLRRYSLEIPIINVAKSRPKMTLEPPFIGRAVCAALFRRLHKRIGDFAGGSCLVLGFGAIGQRVAEFINSYLGCPRSHTYIFDTEQDRRGQAARLGYSLWNRDDLHTRFDLVVGCSGRSSFTIGDYVYLKDGAVLASASSGSVEMSRQDFIDLADTSSFDDIEIYRGGLNESDVHSDLKFRLVDCEVEFLNGGFPINFDGQVNCVPGRYIQPTVTMMVAGAVQAIETKGTGIIPLESEFCDWVEDAFRTELGVEASVLNPIQGI
jgi:S-adenosylhomocysteine hydrolase